DNEGGLPPLKGVELPNVTFTDITDKAGIRFHHTNGSFGKKLLPETMGSGVAFLDFDNDGHQDLLLIDSCYWPGHEGTGKPGLRLYRNKGNGTFEDVTEKMKLNVTLYGMGVAVGDYDNDGYPDVFITAVGGNRLFHNDRGQGFTDVTDRMGVGGPGGWPAGTKNFLEHKDPITFSTSATFLDYDGDGRLDLFVCNYVTWSPTRDLSQSFTLVGGTRAFGPPTSFDGAQCFLYRNAGDHFEDVSEKAGIQVWEKEGTGDQARLRGAGKSLGVLVCDVDEDGGPDIVVANDTVRNFFFHNVAAPERPGGRGFVERGLTTGIAYAGSSPSARGAMGIDWGEYRPGKHAFLIANFATEPSTFLRQNGPGALAFQDVAMPEGLYGPTRSPLKFGAFFFDYDLDGRLDLLTANGHLEPEITKTLPTQTYAQPAQLFWNTGLDKQRAFEEVKAAHAGKDLFQPMVGRGSAYADIDGNGTLDVVLTGNGGPARLFRNNGGTGNNWIRLVLKGDGKRSNASAIGARVEVKVGDQVIHREVVGARGYLSQSELPITVGLGKATRVDSVTIYWPGKNADKQVVTKDLKINSVRTIAQE
ncbi:MAG TPA: CRTAC1 family protein, partial [Gemmataceae bacterium]|nr:CRTAC1 family protein [Gemmataceae bacterium]